MKELHRSKIAAFHLQGGSCYYCGFEMWMRSPDELIQMHGYTKRQAALLQCTAEHLLPKCEGGSDGPRNIVAACRRCNHLRHKRSAPPSPERYMKLVQSRLARNRWHPFRRLPAKEIYFESWAAYCSCSVSRQC